MIVGVFNAFSSYETGRWAGGTKIGFSFHLYRTLHCPWYGGGVIVLNIKEKMNDVPLLRKAI